MTGRATDTILFPGGVGNMRLLSMSVQTQYMWGHSWSDRDTAAAIRTAHFALVELPDKFHMHMSR